MWWFVVWVLCEVFLCGLFFYKTNTESYRGFVSFHLLRTWGKSTQHTPQNTMLLTRHQVARAVPSRGRRGAELDPHHPRRFRAVTGGQSHRAYRGPPPPPPRPTSGLRPQKPPAPARLRGGRPEGSLAPPAAAAEHRHSTGPPPTPTRSEPRKPPPCARQERTPCQNKLYFLKKKKQEREAAASRAPQPRQRPRRSRSLSRRKTNPPPRPATTPGRHGPASAEGAALAGRGRRERRVRRASCLPACLPPSLPPAGTCAGSTRTRRPAAPWWRRRRRGGRGKAARRAAAAGGSGGRCPYPGWGTAPAPPAPSSRPRRHRERARGGRPRPPRDAALPPPS